MNKNCDTFWLKQEIFEDDDLAEHFMEKVKISCEYH